MRTDMRDLGRDRDRDRPSYAMRLAVSLGVVGAAGCAYGLAPGAEGAAVLGLASFAAGVVLGAAVIRWGAAS